MSTVTELATNVALDGDVPTAIEMVAAQLPGATYHLRAAQPRGAHACARRSRAGRSRRETTTSAVGASPPRRSSTSPGRACPRARRPSSCASCSPTPSFECGDVDYGIAQLTSLLDDLRTSRWAISDFTEAVTAELEEWRNVQRGGAPRE